MQFMGYRRPDGRVGVRNYVAVVSTVFCSASVVRMIASATGAKEITHDGGCGQLGPDKVHTERVLRGVVGHPNVGVVLVVGLGCEQIDAATLVATAAGKPARTVDIHAVGGNQAAVEAGTQMVRELMAEAAKAERQPARVDELILATQCGSSDTGSGLASNPAVGVLADNLVAAGGTVLLG